MGPPTAFRSQSSGTSQKDGDDGGGGGGGGADDGRLLPTHLARLAAVARKTRMCCCNWKETEADEANCSSSITVSEQAPGRCVSPREEERSHNSLNIQVNSLPPYKCTIHPETTKLPLLQLGANGNYVLPRATN